MWHEDRHNALVQASKDADDAKIASNLKNKYGLDFAEMMPLYPDGVGGWTAKVSPSKGRTRMSPLHSPAQWLPLCT